MRPARFVGKDEANFPGGYELEREGDFYWLMDGQDRRTLCVAIPQAGTTDLWIFSPWPIDHPNSGGHQWSWDGNEEIPTLQPSLHAIGIWHGWVRDGHLVEA